MTEVRLEQPADIDAIRELVRLAFAAGPHSSGTEPLIIDALRADDALALSLVAEVDGAVIEASLEIIRSRDACGCVLVGDPDLYRRFGFRNCPKVTWPGVPDEYVLCLPFGEEEPAGEIACHRAFLAGT